MRFPISTTRVLASRRLNDNAFELYLERAPGFHFSPGQRLRVHWGAHEREYSIASSPADEHLMLCVRRVSGGTVSPLMAALSPGEPVQVSGPYGHFRYQSREHRAVFVATGTGIAPFRAMIADGCGAGESLVLHGIRSAKDLFYRELFLTGAGCYRACLSGADAPGGADIFQGRVTDYVAHHLAPGRYDFYLCGRQDMIRDVILIVDDQFSAARIFTEAFY
ncbi:MAG: FAD-binding oxidoreductase [Pseudomonadota bacterium]